MIKRASFRPLAVLFFSLCLAGGTAQANTFGGLSEWFNDNLIDPQDGMLDSSDYLASHAGFLPIPIIVTESAVGFGFGAAVAYFHPPKELDSAVHGHDGPPSITVGFAARTDNDTNLYGGAHSGIWKDDNGRCRWLGLPLPPGAENGAPGRPGPGQGAGGYGYLSDRRQRLVRAGL